ASGASRPAVNGRTGCAGRRIVPCRLAPRRVDHGARCDSRCGGQAGLGRAEVTSTVDEPDATTDRIRVFVVDDHAVVRRGMRSFFATLEDIEVVGEAVDGKAALDELAVAAGGGLLPDVVLMDLVMPRLDGVSAIAAIKSAYPAVEVVAMTSFSEAERVHAALSAGA